MEAIMTRNAQTDIIATRTFFLADGGAVTLVIGRPENFPGGEDFRSSFQIIGIGDEKLRYALGADSMQALVIALKIAATYLKQSDEYRAGRLTWGGALKPGDLGLPTLDG